MLYKLVKWLVRAALLIFFRKIYFSNKVFLQQKGPLLLACNHPNSFLDAVILGAFFKHPVNFLARGDAFRKPLLNKILTALHLIPIYRLKEGKEYLALNDTTFKKCAEILSNNGIVLIFSEGLCENTWALRLLKKGSARIAITAWQQANAARFSILPVSLNYSSYTATRKTLLVHFGEPIYQSAVDLQKTEGEIITALNRLIFDGLLRGLLLTRNGEGVIPFLLNNYNGRVTTGTIETLQNAVSDLSEHAAKIQKLYGTQLISNLHKAIIALSIVFLAIPACLGWAANAPFYVFAKRFVKKKTAGTCFYHSVLFGICLLLYPLYTFLVSIIVIGFAGVEGALVLPLLPLLGKCTLLFKDEVEKFKNMERLSPPEQKLLHSILHV